MLYDRRPALKRLMVFCYSVSITRSYLAGSADLIDFPLQPHQEFVQLLIYRDEFCYLSNTRSIHLDHLYQLPDCLYFMLFLLS